MMRRILCVEDDEAISELVCEVLTEAGFRVALAASGTAGLACANAGPDAVICDIDLPGMSGLDILRSLRAKGSQVPFIVLTAFNDRSNQIEARKLGCDDFVTKPIDFELLLAVLENVLQRSAPGPRSEEPTPRLTEREREIFGWIAKGKSSADVAGIVGITERTVNFHVDRVMRKLDVTTRVQAAIACVTRRLIDP